MADLNEPKKETVRITLPPRTTAKPAATGENKETVRINLPSRPPGAGAAPLRPPLRPSNGTSHALVRPPNMLTAPKPLPPLGGSGVRPPPPPMARPPAPIGASTTAPRPPAPPAASAPLPPGAIRPSSAPPLAPAGLKPPVPPALRPPTVPPRPPVAPAAEVKPPASPTKPTFSPTAPAAAKPAGPKSPTSSPLPGAMEHGPVVGPRKETARIAVAPESPMKATVRLTQTQPLNAPPMGAIHTASAPKVAPIASGALIESVPPAFCWALLGVSALTLLIQLWTYFS